MTSILYMIATPLGNLGDITLRALEEMRRIEYFFAEDSREFQKLLMALNIPNEGKKVYSYASHNLKEATERAMEFLREGKTLGLVTDRGTPAISDPGAQLAALAHAEGFKVIPIPGASSVAALLSVSGVDSTSFEFCGFLPLQDKSRKALWKRIRESKLPLVFFESAKRVRESFLELKAEFPLGRLFIGREMTKKFEEYRWLTLATSNAEELSELGEYALILEPGKTANVEAEAWESEIDLRLAPDKQWAKEIARRYEVASSDVYNLLKKKANLVKD